MNNILLLVTMYPKLKDGWLLPPARAVRKFNYFGKVKIFAYQIAYFWRELQPFSAIQSGSV